MKNCRRLLIAILLLFVGTSKALRPPAGKIDQSLFWPKVGLLFFLEFLLMTFSFIPIQILCWIQVEPLRRTTKIKRNLRYSLKFSDQSPANCNLFQLCTEKKVFFLNYIQLLRVQKEGGEDLMLSPYATGSSLPDCSHACGPCFPCKRVMVSFKCSIAESCPIVYRCMCKGKYYHVPSNWRNQFDFPSSHGKYICS